MDYRTLHAKTVAELRQIARAEGVKIPAGTNKALMVEMICEAQTKREAQETVQKPAEETATVQPRKRGRPRKNPVVPEAAEVKPTVVETETAAPGTQAAPSVEAEKTETPSAAETKVEKVQSPAETQTQTEVANTENKDIESAPQRGYQRTLSTQQRMGARTQPVQGYRTQQRQPGPTRFNVETQQGRPMRMQDNMRKRPQDQNSQPPRQQTFKAADQNSQPPRQQTFRAPDQNRTLGTQDQPQTYRTPDQPSTEASAWRRPAAAQGDTANPNPIDRNQVNPAVPEMLASGECGDGAGILEIHPDGYGFLRAENYLPGNHDVYVSSAQIRRFNLRTGDYVVGKTRAQMAGDRSVGLIYINEVNGQTPDAARSRRFFDSLIPVYPNERLSLEKPGQNDLSLRLIDMIAPIGKGQRGMIVSQPKAGKTTLLKKVANAITANNPEVYLIVLLIDERPEEVTDMKRSISGEVVYSTFDEAPENHTRVSEMVLERAQRLVELGKDVVILLDSITRLARAYNLVIPPTGRSLSGGLDPGALLRPKRFFGAARNIENGGSLTIIATALVDTGSRMDDIIFEEFKGTGNMELHLDRSLSDRRIFPAIDLFKSGTRREELLLNKEELEGAYRVRRMLSKGNPQDTAEELISMVEKTKTNAEFFQRLQGWANACEKGGYK